MKKKQSKTKAWRMVELEDQLKTKRSQMQQLDMEMKTGLSIDKYTEVCRRRNLISVDIEIIRRKLDYLRHGKNEHGEPEYSMCEGRISGGAL